MLYSVRNSNCYTYFCDSSAETNQKALEFLGLFKTNRAASVERADFNQASPLMGNREFL